jgi:hypothetical protein
VVTDECIGASACLCGAKANTAGYKQERRSAGSVSPVLSFRPSFPSFPWSHFFLSSFHPFVPSLPCSYFFLSILPFPQTDPLPPAPRTVLFAAGIAESLVFFFLVFFGQSGIFCISRNCETAIFVFSEKLRHTGNELLRTSSRQRWYILRKSVHGTYSRSRAN